jgi:hypothetical protein
MIFGFVFNPFLAFHTKYCPATVYNFPLQRQFNIFVINLREQYKGKVATFRQVIDVHRSELQSKESYWNEMLEVQVLYILSNIMQVENFYREFAVFKILSW